MRVYLAYFILAFRNNTVYRIQYLMGLVNTCLQIFISCMIWRALYSDIDNVKGITYAVVVTNFIISQGLGNAFSTNDFAIQHKLWDGSIAMDLLKPIDMQLVIIMQNLGNIMFNLITNFLPALMISIIIFPVMPPNGIMNFLFFLISIVLGFLILGAVSNIVQMSAFWIMNVWSVSTIKNVLIGVLAGSSLPLWFMPGFMMKIIEFTPFDSIYYMPIRIYLGQNSWNDIMYCYMKQILWFIILFIIGQIMWTKGKKRVVVQGG